MEVRLVRTSRRPAWPLWSIVVVAAWLGLIAATVAAARAFGREISVCVFRRLTGLPCPTCGMTRGALSMLRGEVLAGWAYNPLMFTLLGLAAAATLARAALARKLEVRMTRRERRLAWAALAALVLLNWAYLIRYVG